MARSIKTAEAEELARSLARLARERARRATEADLRARLASLPGHLRAAYDTRPVSREEWNAAAGDDG